MVRGVLGLVVLGLVAGLLGSPSAAAGVSSSLVVPYGGTVRQVRLYVPARVPATRPVPLVLVLHGLHLDPARAEADSGFDRVADTDDVVVAYPAALDGSWNAGTCCGTSSARHVDDVGFLVRLTELVSAMRPVDPRRVYLAGFSNGGMLALKAVCDRPDVFAAALSVAGTLQARCSGARPVSALLVNGLQDRTVPYGGARWSGFLQTALTPVPSARDALARRSGCGRSRTRSTGAYSELTYQGCRGGTSVAAVVAPRLGHRWPVLARDGLGAEQLGWAFLARQRLPS